MTQITTGQQIDPRGVDHPAHYNKHPSGIEAIEVCRFMNFNVGSAFKYVYRRGDKVEHGMTKEQAIQKDLNKALWYIRDERKNCCGVPVAGYGVGAVKAGVQALINVIVHESNHEAAEVYRSFSYLGTCCDSQEYLEALEALDTDMEALKKHECSAV